MAQMSLEELYRGESAGEKYGILGKVMKDFFENGRPSVLGLKCCLSSTR